jgi:hypothetical protein
MHGDTVKQVLNKFSRINIGNVQYHYRGNYKVKYVMLT